MCVELTASIYIMPTYNTMVNNVTSLVNYRHQLLLEIVEMLLLICHAKDAATLIQ